MATVIQQIIDKIPKNKQISNQSYEGANIILYTKSKEFFNNGLPLIKELVNEFKKRIELRLDPDLLTTEKKAEEEVMKIVPKSANITRVLFEPARSVMIIDAQNPNEVIGPRGATIKKIKEETFWKPEVRRDSVIPSKITDLIRKVLHEDSKERRKFLNKVGERIYEFNRARKDSEMWCRISFLGAAQQVGRSAFLLQTPESNVLIDCGINPATSDSSTYPRIN
ncbi:MAG: beta-CASP ribonuclease aCPSF1, partial [Candidatus Nanoarchaeia archaeon]|nr:beta-CASP ribonuclease aCPSF1 [Candidatus Nanoarchaeia archaeon]